jgi:hypothetical protein
MESGRRHVHLPNQAPRPAPGLRHALPPYYTEAAGTPTQPKTGPDLLLAEQLPGGRATVQRDGPGMP